MDWLWRWGWWYRVPKPGLVYIYLKEDVMPNTFRVTALLPSETAPDVSSRRVTISRNGVVDSPVDIPVSQPNYAFLAKQDDEVQFALANVDDVGNASEASVAVFTVIDTVPPSTPGAVQFTLEEVADEVAEPVEEPAVEPAPEAEEPPAE